jgi:hypothetical protein
MEKIKRIINRFRRWKYAGLLVLVLITLVLHLVSMMLPTSAVFDEAHYIPDAKVVMQGDPTQRPEHPPLSKLMLIAGIELFGDNPVGWRFFPILASTGAVIFFYLICRRLNLSRKASYIATFLLGLENLTFVHGQIAMLDIYAIFLMMLAFWLYLKEKFVLCGAAIAIGAMAKFTGIFVLGVIGLHWLLAGGFAGNWRPAALDARPEERERSLFRRLLAPAIAALDVLVVVLLLVGAWVYYKAGYSLFGYIFNLSTTAKITAALSILLILMHSVFARIVDDAWRQVGRSVTAFSLGLGRRCYWLWLFIRTNWSRIRVLPVAVVAGLILLGLMPVLDFGVFHQWFNPAAQADPIDLNPIERIKQMSDIAGQITYDWVDPTSGSRPWMWILKPDVMVYWMTDFWYWPHYIGMISPTLWVLIMPLFLFMLYKALRGDMKVLLPLAWFLCLYMIWIPGSLITNRVTYLFYFYPTVGAIAIALAIAMTPLLKRVRGRGVIAGFLLLHTAAFVVLSPVKPIWSIPLCLAAYIFSFWYLGLGRGLNCRRIFQRRARPEPAPIDIQQPAG